MINVQIKNEDKIQQNNEDREMIKWDFGVLRENDWQKMSAVIETSFSTHYLKSDSRLENNAKSQ